MNNQPAIVICAYNRPRSLARLLLSVSQAHFPADVLLVISIDKSEAAEVSKLVQEFEWKHGEKRIILHEKHLGLKQHVLFCGSLTNEYESIIVLEDDLLVSPFFYQYATQALAYYEHEEAIAGISLYNYEVSEGFFHPFKAIDDESDVYFVQMASSWGQLWTKKQWSGFMEWFNEHHEIDAAGIPEYLHEWGPHSWKKYFIHYLIDKNKFFVFPRLSLSTNFEEAGTNQSSKGIFLVSIQSTERLYAFIDFKKSVAVYDAWFEMLPQCVKKLNQDLNSYDFAVDLYGTKKTAALKNKFVLTTRAVEKSVFSFDKSLFPFEINIKLGLSGNGISLARIEGNSFGKSSVELRNRLKEAKKEEKKDVAVIIPVAHVNAIQLKQSLDSLSQQTFAYVQVVVVSTEEKFNEIDNILSEYNLSVQKMVKQGEAGRWSLLRFAFQTVEHELMLWMNPGTILEKDALYHSVQIFNKYSHVNWVRGMEEKEMSVKPDKQIETLHHRLTPSIALGRLKKNELNVSLELQILRKHCLKEELRQDISEAALFFELLLKHELFCVVLPFGTKIDQINTGKVSFSEKKSLREKYALLEKSPSFIQTLALFIVKMPFFRKNSGQWLPAALHNIPPVIRYHTASDSYYFLYY